MSLREDRVKSLLLDHPEYLPVSASILPGAWMKYRDELKALVRNYPVLFGPASDQDRDYDAADGKYMEGSFTDAWGCVWSNVATGLSSIVTHHPVPTREAVRMLEEPKEDIGFPHGFMFLRLTDLRGFEEMMIDFAEEPEELQMLLDIVLDYNVRQAHNRLKGLPSEPQLVCFGDDLGMQNSLPVSPQSWRKYLKPCFGRIYAPFVQAGHYIYMHTDGHILEIIPDLVDCGVRVVNPQVRANGLTQLADVCKGKVCVDLDLDRQMFPFCTPDDITEHVREAVAILGAPEGGLWLKAEIGPDVPLENIDTIFRELERARGSFRP